MIFFIIIEIWLKLFYTLVDTKVNKNFIWVKIFTLQFPEVELVGFLGFGLQSIIKGGEEIESCKLLKLVY